MQVLRAACLSARFPRLLLSSFVALAALCLLVWSIGVQAAPVADPEAPGSIAGVVTNDQGAPLAGIEVRLYSQQGYSSLLRQTTTDVDGAYRFSALRPGIYQVEFRDPAGIYGFQFYADTGVFAEADEILVSGNQVEGIDGRLHPAGAIAGQITTTSGITLFYATLTLYRQERLNEWREYTITYTQPGQQQYRITGLAAGVYHLCAESYLLEEIVAECFDNQPRYGAIAPGTPITVQTGVTTSQINFVLGDRSILPAIEGFVRNEAGEALAGMSVQLWQENEYGWQPQGERTTNHQGYVRFGYLTVPGRYRLMVNDPAGVYMRKFFENALTLAEASIIDLSPTNPQRAVTVTLAPGGRITGTVTVAGEVAPLVGAVFVMREPHEPFADLWSAPINAATGHYTVGGLPPGTYWVQLHAYWDQLDFIRYYGGSWETRVLIEVGTEETVPNINFDLGQFEAAITGTVTYEGKPQADMQVTLHHATSGTGEISSVIVYTHTDAAGAYRFNGLGPGDYHVRVSDPRGRFASVFYGATPDGPRSAPVAVPADTVVPQINIALTPGGGIQGRITRHNGAPVVSAYVVVYSMRQNIWGAHSWAAVYSNEQGFYELRGLEPGVYRLFFQAQDGSDLSEYYPNADQLALAADISIQASTVTLINLILGPDVVVHLPLVASDLQPGALDFGSTSQQ
jgi:protocatechuate 3,4-dioxygenase beta subunit